MKSASTIHRLEVTAVWHNTVLAVEHLDEGGSFTLGSGTGVSLPYSAPGLDDAVPFVMAEVVEGLRRINLPAKATAEYLSPDGKVVDLRAGDRLLPHPQLLGVKVLQLPTDARAKVQLGELTLVFAVVRGLAAAKVLRPKFDTGGMRWLGLAVGLHALVAALVLSAPVRADDLTFDHLDMEQRWAEIAFKPEVAKVEPPPIGPEAAGGEGEAPTELTQVAPERPTPTAEPSGGAPTTEVERERGRQVARQLAGEVTAALDGIGDPLGMDASQALASMNGTELGIPSGFGGIGLANGGNGRYGGPGTGHSLTAGRVATNGGRTYRPGGPARAKTTRVPKGPKITRGKPVVSDGLSRTQIQRVVRRMRRQYETCYTKALQSQRDLNGKLTVKFTIGGQGTVLAAKIVQADSTMGHAGVERCVERRIKQWRFPAPQGGGLVVVKYPFIFRPTN